MKASARFWRHVEKIDGGCWLWRAATLPNGYGVFGWGAEQVYAHRFAYELVVGPIPEGLDLDHVKARGCSSRACVNPAHLEPVTRRENLLRGDTLPARSLARDACPKGHPYSGENLKRRPNRTGRECYTCDRERAARKRGSDPANARGPYRRKRDVAAKPAPTLFGG